MRTDLLQVFQSMLSSSVEAVCKMQERNSTFPLGAVRIQYESEFVMSALLYLKQAVLLQNEELELQYKTSYARILDAKRKFLEASQRYYELSQIGNREINGLQV